MHVADRKSERFLVSRDSASRGYAKHNNNNERINCKSPEGIGFNYKLLVVVDDQEDIFEESKISYGRPYIKSVIPEKANQKGGDLVIYGENLGSMQYMQNITAF